MHLFENRFIVLDRRRGLDLATGCPVRLRRTRGHVVPTPRPDGGLEGDWEGPWGDDSRVLDWGACGRNEWFIARRASPIPRDSVRVRRDRGLTSADAETRRSVADLLRALDDVLGTVRWREFRLVRLTGSTRPAIEQAACEAARLARQRGFVPIGNAVIDADPASVLGVRASRLWKVVAARHLFVLYRRADESPESCWRLAHVLHRLVDAAGHPRVVMVVEPPLAHARVRRDDPAHPLVRLEPPWWEPSSSRFACDMPTDRLASRVAEAEPSYGHTVDGEAADRSVVIAAEPDWLERAERALTLAGRGRHAQAERLLRDAIGRCARRGLVVEAAQAGVALGRILMRRGRAAEAATAFTAARERFGERNRTGEMSRASVYLGLASTDDRRFDEAEIALAAARAAALADADRVLERFAAVALGRCLLWAGRVDRARAVLQPASAAPGGYGGTTGRQGASTQSGHVVHDAGDAPAPHLGQGGPPGGWSRAAGDLDLEVAEACLEAGVWARLGDLSAADALGVRALARAEAVGSQDDRAAAHTALAAACAASGEIDRLRHHVARGLDAARMAHAPVRSIRLRLVLVDGLMRAGLLAEARRLSARLLRACPDRLPPLYRAEWHRVLGPAASADDSGVRLTPSSRTTSTRTRWLADRAIELITAAQADGDEAAVTERVVRRLLGQLAACAAGAWGQSPSGPVLLASSGGHLAPTPRLRRVVESGVTLPPARVADGIEAVVPVRFGGTVAGAIVVRWPIDSRIDEESVTSLLATAATAVAPLVRAHVDRTSAAPADAGSGLVGSSDTLVALRQQIVRAGRCPFPVLIEGESGSGKEVVARAIHGASARRARRFVAVNCAAVNDELFEAELFGHARGAFTGAVAERPGLVEEAHGGTLFLDEVTELTPRAQAKLLRVIQDGEIRRVGENVVRPVDVRIQAATNRSLRTETAAGRFRQDLLYRLEVVRIDVPPLREHVEDVPALVRHFWEQATARVGSRATLSPATTAALARYDWPGNVRELQNVLAALAVSAGTRGVVGPANLPASMAAGAALDERGTLEAARSRFERRFVRAALARAGGHRGRAAADLGLSRQGLSKLIARLSLETPER